MEVDLVHIINEIRSLKLESKSFIIGWLSHTESKPSLTRLLFLVIDHITAAIVIRLHYHLYYRLHKKLLLKIVTWQSVKIQTSWGCHDFSHYWKRSLFTIKNSKHALASQPHWHQCMDWMSSENEEGIIQRKFSIYLMHWLPILNNKKTSFIDDSNKWLGP